MRKYQTNFGSQRGRVIPKQGRVISISFKNQTKHKKNPLKSNGCKICIRHMVIATVLSRIKKQKLHPKEISQKLSTEQKISTLVIKEPECCSAL
jgi:hypothetical protein